MNLPELPATLGESTALLAEIKIKQVRLHDYVRMKLDEHDYHGVADAAMDLCELAVLYEIVTRQRATLK